MFVPPYKAILKELSVDPENTSESDTVSISRKFLDFILRCALVNADFDEESYLKYNPDIASAYKRGLLKDPHVHFIGYGYFEGRPGGTPYVDEAWYLKTFSDVREARQSNQVESATDHYQIAGMYEWRAPNPTVAGEIQPWKDALR